MFIVDRIQQFIADPISVLISLLAVLIALSFHEFSHAYVAHRCGDDTALVQGRMTIDPLKHLDLMGFVMMMAVGFGWAKPVPVNPNLFKRKRLDMILVSLAGVSMNLLLAIASIFLLVGLQRVFVNEYLSNFLLTLAILNIGLMVFNLIPIPPLDGYRVVKEILLGHLNLNWMWQYERYGMILLLVLSLAGFTSRIMQPAMNYIFFGLLSLANTVFGF